MSEFHEPSIDDRESDPRVQLADRLRLFFVHAIREQRQRDETNQDRNIYKGAGSLYKTDNGKIKVLLQAPAKDKVLYLDVKDTTEPLRDLPEVWLSIDLVGSDHNTDLEAMVVASESITLHAVVGTNPPAELWVRDDYIGPANLDEEVSVSQFLEIESADPLELVTQQQQIATGWFELLEDYDIRTIASTRNSAA